VKAIQYRELGPPSVLSLVDLPDPVPGPGEAILRVRAAGVNHGDVHFRRGLPGMGTALPKIPGLDAAGVVEALGPGALAPAVGTRVVLNPGVSCGTCERCLGGEKSLCPRYRVIGRESHEGTYADRIAVPAANLIPIPDSLPFAEAAALPVVYLTAWNMLVGRVKPGDTLLILAAASGVGSAAVQIAKLLGASVIATAGNDAKVKRLEKVFGLERVLNHAAADVAREVRAATGKRGADVIVDHVGGRFWVPALRALRHGGTLVTCGATDGFDPASDLRQIFFRQLSVIGVTMGNDAQLARVLDLAFEGKLRPAIDTVFPLADAAKAHERIERRDVVGKFVLSVG
jgi:NADPH:quinone reductase-like Zn-dependent oxidoreductase